MFECSLSCLHVVGSVSLTPCIFVVGHYACGSAYIYIYIYIYAASVVELWFVYFCFPFCSRARHLPTGTGRVKAGTLLCPCWLLIRTLISCTTRADYVVSSVVSALVVYIFVHALWGAQGSYGYFGHIRAPRDPMASSWFLVIVIVSDCIGPKGSCMLDCKNTIQYKQ